MEQWELLRSIDIRAVDRKDLVDITKLKKEDNANGDSDKMKQFLKAVKNPYCFLVGDVVVKSTFTGTVNLKQRMQELVDGF